MNPELEISFIPCVVCDLLVNDSWNGDYKQPAELLWAP